MVLDVLEHVEDQLGFVRRLTAKAAHRILHIGLDLSAQTILPGTRIVITPFRGGLPCHLATRTSLASAPSSASTADPR